MQHVEYESSYIALLKEEEILNPFAVLKEIFQEYSSAAHVQNELYEIMTLAIRRNYWMIYESPLILYKKYKKLIRLFEAGWLIQKIRPDLELYKKLSLPYKDIKVNSSNTKKLIQQDPTTETYQTLISVYNLEPLYSLRSDLYHLFFEGLIPTCVHYTYEFEGHMVIIVERMNDLISALHTIDHNENNKLLSPRDTDLLSKELYEFKSRDTLYDYDKDLYHLFRNSKKEELINAIGISKGILNVTNFWKLNGNPANILHYYHDFLFILDSYWLHYKFLIDEKVDVNIKWKYPKDKKEELLGVKYKWIKKPWKYLHEKFEMKSIHEWRNMLEVCLEDVLSNVKVGYKSHQNDSEILDFIEGLIFLQELSNYEPEI
jgi:hypothetical protein